MMLPAVTDTTDTERPDDVGRSPAVEQVEQQQRQRPDSMDLAMDTPLPMDAGEEAIYEPEYVTETEQVWGPISQQVEAAYGAVQAGAGAMMPHGGSLTQAFGVRNSLYAAGYHTGVDISASMGDAVMAPMGGTVIQAGWNGKYGNTVQIRHPDGKVSLLAHNSGVTVRQGQTVRAGQTVAKAGSTGQSFGVHIHWEVRNPSNRYGDVVDPMQWVRSARSSQPAPRGASTSWTAAAGDKAEVTRQAYSLMRSVGASHDEARMLASFVMPESGGQARIVNSIGATGLWQVLWPVHRGWLPSIGITSQEQLKDPYTNARAAYKIYRDRLPRGVEWARKAWEVYDLGWHYQYLQYV